MRYIEMHHGPVSQGILSPGNSVAATIFPRKFCRSILTQRPHFLGYIAAARKFCPTCASSLPRSMAEFEIGGVTMGHWGPVPPRMPREEAVSFIK